MSIALGPEGSSYAEDIDNIKISDDGELGSALTKSKSVSQASFLNSMLAKNLNDKRKN
jgi:hypothetical protein